MSSKSSKRRRNHKRRLNRALNNPKYENELVMVRLMSDEQLQEQRHFKKPKGRGERPDETRRRCAANREIRRRDGDSRDLYTITYSTPSPPEGIWTIVP